MSHFTERADDYIRRVHRTADRALIMRPEQIYPEVAIGELIPGVTFREIWPYDDGNWSPLTPYIAWTDPPQPREGDRMRLRDFRVPRKFEAATARWLISTLFLSLKEKRREV